MTLPPEPFGRKLCRAREDVAHLAIDDVARRVSQWMAVSTSTLSRMEHAETPPQRETARTIATLVALTCGVDPDEFGLGLEDLPPAWDRSAVIASLEASSAWIDTTAGQAA